MPCSRRRTRRGRRFRQSAWRNRSIPGKPVFVDFTANWCLNCKYNERFVLNSDSVKDAFKKAGVIALKADWTNGDADITALLRKFGRAGVPVYAVYPAAGGEPVILPEILTQQEVLDSLAPGHNPG